MEFSEIKIPDLQLGHSVDVNSSSGGASCMINISLPEGRNGFGPALSVNYSSSAGNSLFGKGWSLAGLPFVSVDTRKGLPKYDGSDNFVFNGTVSIVPLLVKSGSSLIGKIRENAGYWIYYYRSKQEEGFTRFEKWKNKLTGEIHWRTWSKNNTVSVYGLDPAGSTRISDPENKHKIFIWLLEARYDNAGNAIQYDYKPENGENVNSLSSYESNRIRYFSKHGFTQKYPERILYGNTMPLMPDQPVPPGNKWLFEVVFDYGEYQDRPYTSSRPQPGSTRDSREDPFSLYNPGFEMRTYRLCKRILVYHHFDELNTPTSLTGIYRFYHHERETVTTLTGVSYTGIRRDKVAGTYTEKNLPELTFRYTEPEIGRTFTRSAAVTSENLPRGFNHSKTRLTDLFGEGLPGILTESASTWYYKPNLGKGLFGKQEIIISKPVGGLDSYALGDFDQDGNVNLYMLQGRMAGFYEYDRDKEVWSGFTPFKHIPQVDRFRFIDVNSDGFPDLVVEREDRIVCYPFKGKEGYDEPYEFAKPLSNGLEYAPTIGNNPSLGYFLADMTGDGLPDQVRIKNGRVEYYPNLGNGHFGQVVVMENPPVIDFDSSLDPGRIRLYDLDGSGTTDLIYIGNGEIRYWYNGSGNKFTEGGRITGLPYIDDLSSAIIVDFLGQGTPCLVWSASADSQQSSLQYLELTGGIRPGLLISVDNGMGKEVQIEYGYSAMHYLDAKREGRPWISKLPSHFTVADKKMVIDHITNARFVTQYKYFDGHYDGKERTFVTFGLTEQFDTALYENSSITHDKDYSQPACSKTWFHNGIFGWDARRAGQFYGKDPLQPLLVAHSFEQDDALEGEDFERGLRSLAGGILRQEIYAADPLGMPADHPYQVVQNAYCIRKLQPGSEKHDSSFFAYQSEILTINYEQDAADPRIAHHISVSVDEYGETYKDLSIYYARRSAAAGRLPLQSKDYISAAVHSFVNIDDANRYQTGLLVESKDYGINHLDRNDSDILKLKDVQLLFDGLTGNALEFDKPLPAGGAPSAKLTSFERTFFWNNSLDDVLPHGQTGHPAIAHHEESACFNGALITQLFAGKVTPAMLSGNDEGRYAEKDGYWWQQTAVNHFSNASGFYQLAKVVREPGNETSYRYDHYNLNIIEITDPLGNVTSGEIDYNIIEPFRLTDPNGNISEVLYDPLGVPVITFSQGTVSGTNNTAQPYGNGLSADYTRRDDESFLNILTNPLAYLQTADTYICYDFEVWRTEKKPLRSISLIRENLRHNGTGNIDNTVKAQVAIDYQDGFGRIIQSKHKVGPGPAIVRKADGSLDTGADGEPLLSHAGERWQVSGHVVYNNKQQPVRQFEPFFSPKGDFENDNELENYGVSTQNYYDAAGRVYRTEFPNSTFTEIIFKPWEVHAFDENDTVDRSLYKTFREVLPGTVPERMALDRSLAHKETQTIAQLDPLGREVVTIQKNNDGTVRKTENIYDNNGNISEIFDARDLKAFEYKRDMLGRLLYEKSIDAGEKWIFHNNLDQTIHLWDSRDIHQRTRYDRLDRVVSVHVGGGSFPDHIAERFVYGEDPSIAEPAKNNLKGQLVRHYDQAGTREIKLYTPRGMPLRVERKLASQYIAGPDWDNPATVPLKAGTYVSEYIYDAMGRPLQQKLPDKTVRKLLFNQAGQVEKLLVSTGDGILDEAELLKNATYDARGFRQSALLGNDVEISYTYDSETFRMKRLRSFRTAGAPRTYQDIHYTYDPVGNLIHMVDQSQQPAAPNPHVLQGLNVSSHSEFEYDALYQLKTAGGRVHQALLQHDYTDRSREAGVPVNWGKGSRHITLDNGAAIERYTRTYSYDVAGNIKSIHHSGASQNWDRQIWTSPASNRSLPLNDLGGVAVSNPENRFDAAGNCIYLPHLRSVEWNYRNNIARAVVIDRSAQGKPNDEEYYVYDGTGIRIRKITQRVVDTATDTVELTEKIYLDGGEIKTITRGGTEILKRYTSRVTDGTNNVATIHSWEKDTQARETDNTGVPKIHYQLSNHLGSASMELDENGDLITFEEYFPYGGTSFIAGRSRREIDLREYRYSAKERDDFTGLYYFGYRYYAHWIGGWMSPDPLGPEDSENLYLYVFNNPINLVDPNGLETAGVSKIGEVSAGLSASEAMNQFNSSQGVRLGIRVTELESRGDDWYIASYRQLTQREIDRFREIQDRWGDNPEMAEFFTNLEVTLSVLDDSDITGILSGTEQGEDAGPGNDQADEGAENSEQDEGSDVSSSDTGGPEETGNVTGNDGTRVNGHQVQDDQGSEVNPGDRSGAEEPGPGRGRKGSGRGGGGDTKNDPADDIPGRGSGAGRGGSGGSGQGASPGAGNTAGIGRPGGRQGGSENGRVGGEIGGQGDADLPVGSGQEGGTEGDPRGLPGEGGGKDPEGSADGRESQVPGDGASQQGSPGEPGGGENGGQQREGQQREGQQREGQQGDPDANWLDTATRWAGYLNLEFGSDEPGEAGGIPGGMNLFNLRLPMWLKRTAQVAYIATTVITTVIPVGKLVLGAKLGVKALIAGTRAAAKKLVSAAVRSGAAIRGALQRARGAIGSGLSRIRGLFKRKPVISSGATGNPAAILRGFGELSRRQQKVLSRLGREGDQIIIPKRGFGLNDLSALTAATGDEFAMFTAGGRRLIIRGGKGTVPVGPEEARRLASQGWRWSAHTHPGTGSNVLRSSLGDRAVLGEFSNAKSAILNSEGNRSIFEAAGDLLTGWLPR